MHKFILIVFIFACGKTIQKTSSELGPVGVPQLDQYSKSAPRLSPEQFSANLSQSLGVTIGYDYQGKIYDLLLVYFAVPLGGLDFLNKVRFREPLAKVQTVLVSRYIAWISTYLFMMKEKDPSTRKVFQILSPEEKVSSQTQKFKDQLVLLFHATLGREPSSSEISIVENRFHNILKINPSASFLAWALTTYALLSSMEAWHVLRG